MPANRIVTVLTILSGLTAAIAVPLADLDTTSVLGVLGGLATILGAAVKFLHGSQQWDKLTHGEPPSA